MFGERTTTDEVLAGIDLKGKRVLITGAAAGLGLETARALVSHGADVVGTARDLPKAADATTVVREAAEAKGASFSLVQIDLSSLASVRACADALIADGRSFDIVITNAGVMACPLGRTVEGFEMQFGTNHLGHFVLVNRIASLIAPGGRLVVLSSAGHRYADIDLDDPNFDHTAYAEFVAYGRSKTANALFAVEFDRRYRHRGIRAAAVHPGGIVTDLMRHMSKEFHDQMMASLNAKQAAAGLPPFEYKTIPQGAATSVWAATAPADEVGGRYCEDCHVAELIDNPEIRGGVQPYAIDPESAKALWAKSEEMVGESY